MNPDKQPMGKFELERHRHNVAEIDKAIAGHEAEVARLQEARREYINRHGLNKLVEKAYPV